MLLELKLPVVDLEGSSRECGQTYGELERESIFGFLSSQLVLRPEMLKFADACWPLLQAELPDIAEFTLGVAAGAGLTISQMMSLLLHEEIVHQEHCSIVGLSANAARDGRSVVAQNWDWPATVYAWPKIVRSRTNGAPAIMTYAFPGLWACAGVNDAGLAIGWSGAGYWPSVPPIPGIPTYALVAGVLASQDVSSAIRLLGNRRHAGCFIFFLADRGGELAVVEGWPGHLAVARNEMIAARTNHYVMPNVIAAVNQRDPFSIRDSTTAPRLESLRALLSRNQEWITGNVLREILCHQEIRASYSLDTSGHGYNSMTIDSFCMYPDTAELLVARGLPDRHDFIRYTLASSQRDEQPVIHQEVAQNGRNSGTGSHPGAGTR